MALRKRSLSGYARIGGPPEGYRRAARHLDAASTYSRTRLESWALKRPRGTDGGEILLDPTIPEARARIREDVAV